MSHVESVASSAVIVTLVFSHSKIYIRYFRLNSKRREFFLILKVRAATIVKAAMIVVFTSSGRAARCSFITKSQTAINKKGVTPCLLGTFASGLTIRRI